MFSNFLMFSESNLRRQVYNGYRVNLTPNGFEILSTNIRELKEKYSSNTAQANSNIQFLNTLNQILQNYIDDKVNSKKSEMAVNELLKQNAAHTCKYLAASIAAHFSAMHRYSQCTQTYKMIENPQHSTPYALKEVEEAKVKENNINP